MLNTSSIVLHNGVLRRLCASNFRHRFFGQSAATTTVPTSVLNNTYIDEETVVKTLQQLQKHYSDQALIIEHAFNIYHSMAHPKTAPIITALLKICLHFNALHKTPYLWTDIHNLSTLNPSERSSIHSITAYLLFLKCCTKSPVLPMDHCIKTLELISNLLVSISQDMSTMDRRDYSKSVHRIISQCKSPESLSIIHHLVDRIGIEDVFIQTALLNAYARSKCSNPKETVSQILDIFNGLSNIHKDSAFMNTAMKWLIHFDQFELALMVYDEYTFLHDDISHILALKSAMKCEQSHRGRVVQSQIGPKSDINLKNALIEFFGYFKEIESAIKMFEQIDETQKDRISVGTILKWMVHHGQYVEALEVYDSFEGGLQSLLDDRSHMFAIRACTYSDNFERGKRIRSRLSEDANRDPFIAATLIDFYGNFGSIPTAKRIFTAIPPQKRDLQVISAMMDAYCKSDLHLECLELFKSMSKMRRISPDLVCYTIALKACTQGTAYHFGRILHGELKEDSNLKWMLKTVEIEAGLINFYGKCGDIDICDRLFGESKNMKDIAIWNAIINAYGRNGKPDKAKEMLFNLLKDGITPDIHTFIFLINACGHSGDIEDANIIWEKVADEKVKWNRFVVSALVDCLARHGQFEKARQLVDEYEKLSKVQYHHPMWMALLSGCQRTKDIIMAEQVNSEINQRFRDKNGDILRAASMILANMYGADRNFERRKEIREAVEYNGWSASRGVSEIDINGTVYTFRAGTEYSAMEDGHAIDDKLEELVSVMKKDYGFEHDLECVTRSAELDAGETDESILCRHSEKLALIYGLLHTAKSYQIVINKHAATCSDCLKFIKLVSELEGRRIIVSDPQQVHVFSAGH